MSAKYKVSLTTQERDAIVTMVEFAALVRERNVDDILVRSPMPMSMAGLVKDLPPMSDLLYARIMLDEVLKTNNAMDQYDADTLKELAKNISQYNQRETFYFKEQSVFILHQVSEMVLKADKSISGLLKNQLEFDRDAMLDLEPFFLKPWDALFNNELLEISQIHRGLCQFIKITPSVELVATDKPCPRFEEIDYTVINRRANSMELAS